MSHHLLQVIKFTFCHLHLWNRLYNPLIWPHQSIPIPLDWPIQPTRHPVPSYSTHAAHSARQAPAHSYSAHPAPSAHRASSLFPFCTPGPFGPPRSCPLPFRTPGPFCPLCTKPIHITPMPTWPIQSTAHPAHSACRTPRILLLLTNGKARFVELNIAFARGSAPGANFFKSMA